jgi:hypothetical protein
MSKKTDWIQGDIGKREDFFGVDICTGISKPLIIDEWRSQ